MLLKWDILFSVLVPEEFCYDPATRQYGDPSKRPEIRNATVEFIAPSEYMVCANIILLQYYIYYCLQLVGKEMVNFRRSSDMDILDFFFFSILVAATTAFSIFVCFGCLF